MKDTFDKPPIRIDHEPAIGAPVIALGQQRAAGARPSDLPPWVLPIQRRLDTILRQQDEILYHLQHPWWRRAWDVVASFVKRLAGSD